jgi:hypothetical protein
VITNIESVYSHFKDDGLGLRHCLHAAKIHPQLFYQKPETLIANMEGVYNHFKEHGLELKHYLQAAAKLPALFIQKPETLIGHVNRIIAMYKKGTVSFSTKGSGSADKPLKPLFDFLTRRPMLLTLSHDNFTLREIYAAVTDAACK